MWGRYFFHFLLISVFLLRGAPGRILKTRNIKLQVLRSFMIFSAGITFWAGLMYLPLADCTVMAFISPLLVTVLAVLFLGHPVGLFYLWRSPGWLDNHRGLDYRVQRHLPHPEGKKLRASVCQRKVCCSAERRGIMAPYRFSVGSVCSGRSEQLSC